MQNLSYTLVIPTYNGGELWKNCISSILIQSCKPEKVLVIDSSSKDETVPLAKKAGFETIVINQEDFDHGGTRSFALKFVDTPYVVFLTQDALLYDSNSVKNLLSEFCNESVGAIYGRQLPHDNATPLAVFARLNSYRKQSYITSLNCSEPAGLRKVFLSNSFSAYRVSELKNIGSFPSKLILGEDTYVAAKLLLAGKKIAYSSDSLVKHSHNYSVLEEFKRYFDIGVFHSNQDWMLKKFGKVEGEGFKFAIGQLKYLSSNFAYTWIAKSVCTSLAKYLGYKLGCKHRLLGHFLCRHLSMHKTYWKIDF